jgi:hypothetical protein
VRIRRRRQPEVGVREPFANRLGDAAGGLAISDALSLATAFVVDEDPPGALPELHSHTHGVTPYRKTLFTMSSTADLKSDTLRTFLNCCAHLSNSEHRTRSFPPIR